jgi:hypothetical protein
VIARLAKVLYDFIFGNLAVLIPRGRDGRPMALRPRLSTGLLFSDIICAYYNKGLSIFAFHFSNSAYKFETAIL